MTQNDFVANALLATYKEVLRAKYNSAQYTNRHNPDAAAREMFRNEAYDAAMIAMSCLPEIEEIAKDLAKTEPFDEAGGGGGE